MGGLPLGLVGLGYLLPYFVIAIVLGEFWRAPRGRRRATGEPLPTAFFRLLAQNHRRYGGLVVHLGVVLVAIGVATSSVGKVEREQTLKRGETLEVGPYSVRFTGLSAVEQPTHLLVQAGLEVSEGGRPVGTLQPGQRLYPGSNSPFASVAVRYGFFRDFYVILGSFDREGEWAADQGPDPPDGRLDLAGRRGGAARRRPRALAGRPPRAGPRAGRRPGRHRRRQPDPSRLAIDGRRVPML